MASRGQKVQSNFNAGILSPYVEGRPDVAQYFNGMLTGRNIVLLPEGGFENTPGTKYITATKDNGYAILIPFQPTDTTSFELEFGVGYIRFRKNGEIILDPGAELLTNGEFETDLTGWDDGDEASAISDWSTYLGEGALYLQPEVAAIGFSVVVVGRAIRVQIFATEVGKTYNVTFNAVGLVSLEIADMVAVTTFVSGNYTGVNTVSFVAPSISTRVAFTSGESISAVYVLSASCVEQMTSPYEIATDYTQDDLDEIKGHQGICESVDVLFICCSRVRPKELVYGGDTDWTLRDSPFDPMPSYEAPTDISGGTATLTPAATTGDSINFVASSGVFLAGDVGRVISYGLSRALIVTYTNTSTVVADILVDFPDTNPIPAGLWLLEGSPAGSTFNVPHRSPVGRTMSGSADIATFRAADVGKFIHTYGGTLEIIAVSSSTNVKVRIKSDLTDADKFDPDAAPAGSWTLEVAAWSDTLGWPTLNEFFQGRYVVAANTNQRTTIWMSQTNDFYNFAIGALATDAVQYTHRSGTFGQIKWMSENGGALYFGDVFSEHSLKGPGIDQPVGGDTVPTQKPESHNGSAPVKPIHVGSSLLFLNWSKRKILASAYNFDRDAQIAKQSTFLTRDLPVDVGVYDDQGIDNHAPAYVQEPIPLIYWRRSDGALLVQSFNDDPEGGNNGWTTLELDGDIESYCVTRRGAQDILSLIVARTINGANVRYIEELSRDAHDRVPAGWTEMQTQSGLILSKADISPQTIFTGLSHLEGETVQVLINASGESAADNSLFYAPRYLGDYTVSAGTITLDEEITFVAKLEVGLSLTPFIKTMRVSIAQTPTEGHLRKWTKCMVRLQKSSFPVVNGTDMSVGRSVDTIGQAPYLRSGDIFVDCDDEPTADPKKWDWSLDGYIEITRTKPYPIRILLLAGEVSFSESFGEALLNEGTIHQP